MGQSVHLNEGLLLCTVQICRCSFIAQMSRSIKRVWSILLGVNTHTMTFTFGFSVITNIEKPIGKAPKNTRELSCHISLISIEISQTSFRCRTTNAFHKLSLATCFASTSLSDVKCHLGRCWGPHSTQCPLTASKG